MHLQSVLWYGLLIWLVARLHQVLDSAAPVRARLAALFFATSSLHFTAVAWIAARNQLVAACFTAACVTAFHIWRTRGSPRHGWLAITLFAMALLSAEAGVATLGYLAAHAMVYGGPASAASPHTASWPRRAASALRTLLPFLLV